jgi:hypothetical protein
VAAYPSTSTPSPGRSNTTLVDATHGDLGLCVERDGAAASTALGRRSINWTCRGARLSQGSCKVLRQAVWPARMSAERGRDPVPNLGRRFDRSRPGRADLGRRLALTMQVDAAAVAQEARRRPVVAITAGQAVRS